VVEILSPDDSYRDTKGHAADYLDIGVHAVWIIYPNSKWTVVCEECMDLGTYL
jgi:Uma2 family endonuclease